MKTNKLVVSRDVQVDENFVWNWDKKEVQTLGENFIQGDEETEEETDLDDENAIGIRGTRLLSDVYERCNLALSDPITFEDANQFEAWRDAMQTEIRMINKNKT